MESVNAGAPTTTKPEAIAEATPSTTNPEAIAEATPATIPPAAPAKRKGSITEDDVSILINSYEPTKILILLQEVYQIAGAKIDWKDLAKRTASGVTNARECQMLWRHLAYRDLLWEKVEEGAEPLDDDSDLEFELEALPAVNDEALSEATSYVKSINAGAPKTTKPEAIAEETPATTNPEAIAEATPATTKPEAIAEATPATTNLEAIDEATAATTNTEAIAEATPATTNPEVIAEATPVTIPPAAPAKRKGSITEDDVSMLLNRYEPTKILILLQEVYQIAGAKIDWKDLAKRTASGVTNARECQMLWRHLAYRDLLWEKVEEGAEPLDDDSDLEFELEALPAVSNEALSEATSYVKIMVSSGLTR